MDLRIQISGLSGKCKLLLIMVREKTKQTGWIQGSLFEKKKEDIGMVE